MPQFSCSLEDGRNPPLDWTIAVVDKCTESRELTRYSLRASFPHCAIVEFDSPEALLGKLVLQKVSAVITAYQTWGSDGIALIRELRRRQYAGAILMLTSAHEKEAAAKEAGADAFLASDHWSELPARIATHIMERSVL